MDKRDRTDQAVAAVTLGIFGGWGYVLLLFGGGYLMRNLLTVEVYLALVCVVTAGLLAVLYRWVGTKGALDICRTVKEERKKGTVKSGSFLES